MCNLDVVFIPQDAPYNCWFAALRMVFKYHKGPKAEPLGQPETLKAGADRLREREVVRQRYPAPPNEEPGDTRQRQMQLKEALNQYPHIGLGVQQFAKLASDNGLSAVPLPDGLQWTMDELAELLRRHGPIWCGMSGLCHVVVLRGIDRADNNVILNDPQREAGGTTFKLNRFNQELAKTDHSMLYVDPAKQK
jgi:hypothetical protein